MLLSKAGGDADKFAEEELKAAVVDGRMIQLTHTKHNYSASHPMQYLEMRDGTLLEVFPSEDSRSADEQRYMELYAWWTTKFNRRPITKTNIDEHYTAIRPAGTKHGKEAYKKALQAALDYGFAVEADPPPGASKNPNTKYYALYSLEEQEPSNPSEEDSALVEENEE